MNVPIKTKNRIRKFTKSKKLNKADRDAIRVEAKLHSPGIPPNTCPYIDVTQTMINDLQDAYDKMRETGQHNPLVDEIASRATDTLEFVRKSNETLRDNSSYWYNKYKQLLNK